MKTQKDLEKLQINNEQEGQNDSISLTITPKVIIGILTAIIIIVVATIAIKNLGKKKRVTSTSAQGNNTVVNYETSDSIQGEEKGMGESYLEESISNQEEKYTLYENGELAQINDPNGIFKFGVTEANILKENGWRDAVYQITWVVENESYRSSLGTGTTNDKFRVVDSDGYIVDSMGEGGEGEWVNWLEEDQPRPGEKCKSKFTYVINNPECSYLDVSLDKYKITCRVTIDNLDNAQSVIPDNATKEEKEIIKAAISYVDSCNMSYNGLIHQLEYEGYSHDKAVYGADNCGADWNEQAVLSAKSYINDDYISNRDELIRQLEEGDKFTYDQAVYGADNCGKKW